VQAFRIIYDSDVVLWKVENGTEWFDDSDNEKFDAGFPLHQGCIGDTWQLNQLSAVLNKQKNEFTFANPDAVFATCSRYLVNLSLVLAATAELVSFLLSQLNRG
jgi:hypothetical protein